MIRYKEQNALGICQQFDGPSEPRRGCFTAFRYDAEPIDESDEAPALI